MKAAGGATTTTFVTMDSICQNFDNIFLIKNMMLI